MRLFSPKPDFVVRVWDGEEWLYHRAYAHQDVDWYIACLREQYPGCPVEVVS